MTLLEEIRCVIAGIFSYMSRYVLSIFSAEVSQVGGVRYAWGIPLLAANSLTFFSSAATSAFIRLIGLKADLIESRDPDVRALSSLKNLVLPSGGGG